MNTPLNSCHFFVSFCQLLEFVCFSVCLRIGSLLCSKFSWRTGQGHHFGNEVRRFESAWVWNDSEWLGSFHFWGHFQYFYCIKLFSWCKAPVCISVLVVGSKVCCTAPHSLTSVGLGVVVLCVTDDIPLRICVCTRAVQQDAFSCHELCFFFSCKSCYL
jgi:hypothetical protein